MLRVAYDHRAQRRSQVVLLGGGHVAEPARGVPARGVPARARTTRSNGERGANGAAITKLRFPAARSLAASWGCGAAPGTRVVALAERPQGGHAASDERTTIPHRPRAGRPTDPPAPRRVGHQRREALVEDRGDGGPGQPWVAGSSRGGIPPRRADEGATEVQGSPGSPARDGHGGWPRRAARRASGRSWRAGEIESRALVRRGGQGAKRRWSKGGRRAANGVARSTTGHRACAAERAEAVQVLSVGREQGVTRRRLGGAHTTRVREPGGPTVEAPMGPALGAPVAPTVEAPIGRGRPDRRRRYNAGGPASPP
jgi:hypothetical protein